ncbi:MAG: hypothetical protein RL410_450 [Actinomycetota bacterium]|jgi:hypothetical protein
MTIAPNNVQEVAALPPQEWLQRVIVACIEVVHGKRNIVHVKNVVSAKVAASLTFRATLHAQRKFGQITIASIRASCPRTGCAEVSATFMLNQRGYPIALRVERIATGWLVTALEMGPH